MFPAFCFTLVQFQLSSQALKREGHFLDHIKPSQMVMKETPRKRLRVPPISATIVDEWYRSSSFSTEVYLVEIKMINVNLVETVDMIHVHLVEVDMIRVHLFTWTGRSWRRQSGTT